MQHQARVKIILEFEYGVGFFEQLKKKQFSFFDSISHLCCSFILVVISGSRYWRHLSHTIPTAFKLDHGDLGLI